MHGWREYLNLDDTQLLGQCRQEASRGSGPGGQKRNKTSSAIRLVHEPTGLAVRASEERSQKTNKNNALDRLRMEIAIQLRSKLDVTDFGKFSTKHPITIAIILDALRESNYVISDAAAKLNLSTAKLSKLTCGQLMLLDEVNRQRAILRLRPLRTKE